MKEMKKTLLLTIIIMFLLTLTSCGKGRDSESGLGSKQPVPLGEADIYIYDKSGEKTDLDHVFFMSGDDYSTYRGVKPGDDVKVLAEKYILSEFEVVSLTMERTTATLENIVGEGFMDISADVTVNGKKYNLGFTVNDGNIEMINIYLYPDQ